MLAVTVHDELARAEGVNAFATRLVFTLLLATVIAISMKVVGILLVTSLLIIPAATARRFAGPPEQMAVLASLVGGASVTGGTYASPNWEPPSGHTAGVASLVLFVPGQISSTLKHRTAGRFYIASASGPNPQ